MLAPAKPAFVGSDYLRLLRPHQWTKNGFCLAGVFFSGRWLEDAYSIGTAVGCFGCFCAASSAAYIFNDVVDRERDRLHPLKCQRPVASGAVSVPAALTLASLLAAVALSGAYALGWAVLGCLVLYFANNFAYSWGLKHYALVDVLSIANGFVLRLLAGVYAVGVLPTTWITLCTFFLTVFLGFAKRRAELAGLLEDETTERRPVLSKYTVQLLDSMLNNAAVMAVMCYALFTCISNKNPTLVVTVPIVYFAVMHYKRNVLLWNFGEEPDWILLKDLRVQVSIVLWLACYVIIMYGHLHLFQ
jgi:4-hydroxybenzoate polyprenyltransferase